MNIFMAFCSFTIYPATFRIASMFPNQILAFLFFIKFRLFFLFPPLPHFTGYLLHFFIKDPITSNHSSTHRSLFISVTVLLRSTHLITISPSRLHSYHNTLSSSIIQVWDCTKLFEWPVLCRTDSFHSGRTEQILEWLGVGLQSQGDHSSVLSRNSHEPAEGNQQRSHNKKRDSSKSLFRMDLLRPPWPDPVWIHFSSFQIFFPSRRFIITNHILDSNFPKYFSSQITELVGPTLSTATQFLRISLGRLRVHQMQGSPTVQVWGCCDCHASRIMIHTWPQHQRQHRLPEIALSYSRSYSVHLRLDEVIWDWTQSYT